MKHIKNHHLFEISGINKVKASESGDLEKINRTIERIENAIDENIEYSKNYKYKTERQISDIISIQDLYNKLLELYKAKLNIEKKEKSKKKFNI